MRSTIDRREFGQRIAGAAMVAAVAPSSRAQPAASVPVVDTHLHCFAGPDDPRFPYHPAGPYQPASAATPEHLLQCMDAGGVDFAVVVHPEPYQDDLSYLEHCLHVGGARLKGVALLFADRDDTERRLKALVQRLPGRLVATRVHAYAPGRLPSWNKQEQLRRLWRTAGDLGLAVQVHLEPRYATRLEPFIREHRSVPVVVDHLGRPFQGVPREHDVIVRWARFSQVVMKFAAVPERHEYPHRDIRPVIHQLVSAYGPERIMYGGGFGPTATGASYRAYRDHLASFLPEMSAEGRAMIFGGTARHLFRFAAA